MSASPKKRDGPPVPPTQSSTVILMVRTIADTTWRMFFPAIVFTVGGLLLDKTWHTTPWLTGVGVIVGALIAFLLVRSQMRKVNK